MIDRPKFREIRYSPDVVIPEEYDYVEAKMDGIWGCMVIESGYYRIYSRTGKIKQAGEIDREASDIEGKNILLGEFMHGSNWGHRMDIDKQFFVFDCLEWEGTDIKSFPQLRRWNFAHDLRNRLNDSGLDWVKAVIHSEVDDDYGWRSRWKSLVINKGYEGLIFKKGDAPYGERGAWMRMKGEVEIDYICDGMAPADPKSKYAGQVGAVIGTLYNKECGVKCGGLTEKMRDVFTRRKDTYKGLVFTAKGNGWYTSGAIRHPKFVRWRDDKKPEECVYEQIPREIRAG